MFTTSYWSSDATEESSFYQLFQQLSTNSPFLTPATETETKETVPSETTTTPAAAMVREGSPVLLSATPGTGTIVHNIHRSKGNEQENAGIDSESSSLPINNGSEALGESIVIDFESPLFVGSFLLRVAGVKSSTDDGSTQNYFDGKSRRFQAIVRGKFLKEIPAGQCVTGQTFDRAPQRLPPLTKPILRAVSAIAPQMEIDLYAARPFVLSSLVATAKTLNQRQHPLSNNTNTPTATDVHYLDDPNALSDEQETRKELLEREAVFETDREYTFEFYQHMLDLANPHDFVLTFAGWTVRLGPTLDGQPIRILGAWQEEGKELQYIWSFDLLHETHCQEGTQ